MSIWYLAMISTQVDRAVLLLAKGMSVEDVAEVADMSVEELTEALAKPLDQD